MRHDFTITLDGVPYPVTAEGPTITVNGRPFEVEVSDDGTVLVDGIGYDVALDGETATIAGESVPAQVTGLSATMPVPSPAPPSAAVPAVVSAGAGAVLAIMPGKIVRVVVEPGQRVEEGDAICVLEAMKMENELHARQSGMVRAVHVKPGDDVEKDQVLVEIE
jgi:biotin carboxyl carrier protein